MHKNHKSDYCVEGKKKGKNLSKLCAMKIWKENYRTEKNKFMHVSVHIRILTMLRGNGVFWAGWRSRLGAVSAGAVEGISAGPRSFWIKPASKSKSQLLPGWRWLRTAMRANQRSEKESITIIPLESKGVKKNKKNFLLRIHSCI